MATTTLLSLSKIATGALLTTSTKLQAYARQVEIREPSVATPFYAASCYLRTVATITGAL